MLCFGGNDFGRLGLGDDTEVHEVQSPSPIGCFGGGKVRVTALACGSDHNLAIGEGGRLWSWGLNAQRQCGIGGRSFVYRPEQVRFEGDESDGDGESGSVVCVTDVECGHSHSYCGTKDGGHYLFGSNEYAECLCFDGRTKVRAPYRIDAAVSAMCDGKYVKAVSLGYHNTKLIVRRRVVTRRSVESVDG